MDLDSEETHQLPALAMGWLFFIAAGGLEMRGFHGNQLQLMIGEKRQEHPVCEVMRGRQAQARGCCSISWRYFSKHLVGRWGLAGPGEARLCLEGPGEAGWHPVLLVVLGRTEEACEAWGHLTVASGARWAKAPTA